LRLASGIRGFGDTRGQSLVEFSLVALLSVMLLFGAFEMCRMVLVYTTIANAARAGERYAIVNGSDVTATPPTTAIQNVVKGYLSTGTVNTSGVSPSVTYCSDPTCGTTGNSYNVPGNSVQVSVTYPYDPWVGFFPWGTINLTSTAQGVITY
jgi:Flp pilus assembly protein TadG